MKFREGRWIAWALLCLGGCVNGPQERFFAWCQRDLRTEARTYDFHDPFPNESAGPDTVTRPLAFVDPRSDTRKDFDFRLLLSLVGGTNAPAVAGRPGQPLVSPISPAVPIQTYASPTAPITTQPQRY